MQTLRIGSCGQDVVTLQQRLQQLGFDVGKLDGQFGSKVAGSQTYTKLFPPDRSIDKSVANNLLSPNAYRLILEFEVSSELHYKKSLQHPTLPEVESGITIGIGYDLGYNNAETFNQDWKALKQSDRDRLITCCGLTKEQARAVLEHVKDIIVPWETALEIFQTVTIPKFFNMTCEAFPGMKKLPPDAQGALVSLVFNRGAKTTGARRAEMAEIKRLLTQSDVSMPELLERIADQIRQMKRLWPDIPGLQRRRKAEAKLIEHTLMATVH